jgi:hypothetical protein
MMYLFITGIILGFLVFLIAAIQSQHVLLVSLGNAIYHVHHYLILLPLALLLAIRARHAPSPPLLFAVGFCVGGSLTNLLYRDMFRIRVRDIESYTNRVSIPDSPEGLRPWFRKLLSR